MSDKRFLKTALKPAVEAETAGLLRRINELSKHPREPIRILPSQYEIRRCNEYEFSRRERALKAAVKAHRKQNGRIGPHVSILDIAQWLLDDQEPWKINGDKV